ncbi:VTT domain-containing protein [Patescibacteria group bacterium]|nr:VTT domain-containing protein [Patescibacteria group bacterium]MBU1015518.1 VTT domain-containing protein [Patescibacteria group bacterium]MBU1685636.1 VTT domain-containing protein [Patescibacteria group bacterium]MBU1938129.1 VTT domain-containing protein [Patescibacteria group bacterium]
MHALTLLVKAVILQYGYLGMFLLTALEQFIFPLPVDVFFGFSIEHGLVYQKLMVVVLAATIIGSSIGYFLGRFLGHPALTWLVGKTKVEKGEIYIKKWGIWGVILAGLTPIPFKVVTWTAGIFEMPFGRFLLGVIIGRMPRYMFTAYAGAKFFESKFYATTDMSALILGALQGLTEFLPISSSGHLVIMEKFLYLPIPADHLVTFDIFLHGGSLVAILLYFWKDWVDVFRELWHMIKKASLDTSSLAFKLAVGTIPAIIAGLVFGGSIGKNLRELHYIAILFIILGVIYFYAAWRGRSNTHETVGLKKSIWIGVAQAFALVPGISRAGLTIATGITLGLKREAAAKFSFMLGGVAILAANVYAIFSMRNGAPIPDLDFILMGTVTSFITSLLAIYLLLRFLQKHTMRAFGVYLILAGSLILSFL